MSRSRRAPAHKKDSSATGGGNGGTNKSGNNNGGNNNRGKGGHKAAKGGTANRPGSHTDFWGTPTRLAAPGAGTKDADAVVTIPLIRPSAAPDTMVRSLGSPPLAGHEAIAEHYFAAVYDKAAGLAGALAAAGGLLDFGDASD